MSSPISWLLGTAPPGNPFVPGSVCFDLSLLGIVQSIRDVTYASKSSRDWPVDKIVRLLNRGLMQYLVPLIQSAREEYYVTSIDVNLVSGQQDYAIPSAAAGQNIRVVQTLGLNGAVMQTLNAVDLNIGIQPFGLLAGGVMLGTPTSIYVQGNSLRLVPTPSGSPDAPGLRIFFVQRPSYLIYPANDLGQPFNAVTGTIASSTLVTLDTAVVDPLSPLLATQSLDIIDQSPPFAVLSSSTGTIVSGSTSLVLSPALTLGGSNGLAIGSRVWVCHSGCAPVVTSTAPEFVFGSLMDWVFQEIANAVGDSAQFQRVQSRFSKDEAFTNRFLQKRIKSQGKRAIAMPSTSTAWGNGGQYGR